MISDEQYARLTHKSRQPRVSFNSFVNRHWLESNSTWNGTKTRAVTSEVMSGFLLDTNIVSEIVRPKPDARVGLLD